MVKFCCIMKVKKMTNRYCQAVGCEDAVEAHKLYSPIDRIATTLA